MTQIIAILIYIVVINDNDKGKYEDGIEFSRINQTQKYKITVEIEFLKK